MTRDLCSRKIDRHAGVEQSSEGLGVDLVDTDTLARKVVEQPNGERDRLYQRRPRALSASWAIAAPDEHAGITAIRITYSLSHDRQPRLEAARTVTRSSANSTTGFIPVAVDRDKNVAYGFENQNGRTGLYSVALDGSLTKTLVVDAARRRCRRADPDRPAESRRRRELGHRQARGAIFSIPR